MKALVVYTHPNPESFCAAIYETAVEALTRAGCEVRVRELYDHPFEITLELDDLAALRAGQVPDDVAAEHALIAWADLLVFVYPVWWFDRPARLKGWFDRAWTPGFAFVYDEGGPRGLLEGKQAVVFQTAGAPEAAYAATGDEASIVRPMQEGTLRFCGLEVPAFETFYAVPYVDEATREAMLLRVQSTLTGLAEAPTQPSTASTSSRSRAARSPGCSAM